MLNLLAATVQVTPGPEGDSVIVDPMGPMFMSAVYFLLLLLPVIIILLFFFYKKKLQHQQILAAMEKGLPVKDLMDAPKKKETGWIANISAGIGLIFIAVALLVMYAPAGIYIANHPRNLLVAIPIVIFGMGLTRLLRGYFQKKHEKGDKPEEESEPEALPGGMS